MHPEIRRKPEPAQDVIQDLARQTQRPVDEVRTVYEQQLALLEADAKVKTYLTILATRRARELLSR
jgi:hypothetical protein